MTKITLSILIITYNQEKYIRQTLDSILSQKYKYNYEVVIGDDCSTDSTRNIIASYVSKYPEIIKPIYNEHNLGVIKNYFNVLNNCNGQYIMECAGDDWWLPGKVEKQIDLMEQNYNIGMCYGKAKCFDENGNELNKYVGEKCCNIDELLQCNNIPACTVCFRKDIFDSYINEITPESKSWKMEDYPAWLWMSKNTTIYFINDFLAAYRIVTESVSRTKNIEKQIAFDENTWQIKSFFANKYNIIIEPLNVDELWRTKLFESLLEKYDKKTARELKKRIKLITIKNFIKYIIISSKIFFIIYKYIFRKSLIEKNI